MCAFPKQNTKMYLEKEAKEFIKKYGLWVAVILFVVAVAVLIFL